jgi:pectate lyase
MACPFADRCEEEESILMVFARSRSLILAACCQLLVAGCSGTAEDPSGLGTGGTPAAGGSGAGAADTGGTGGAVDNQTGGSGGVGGSGGSGIGAGGADVGGSAGISSAGEAGSSFGGSVGDGGAAGDVGSGGSSGGTGGAASGGTGGTGTGGTGGGVNTCPTALVGWATVSGDGVSSTTGGGNATPVRPTTVEQLLNYASDSTPRVIEISGTFNVPRLQINSNKTLIGIGNNATINGGLRIRGYAHSPVSNVIIRNLRVNGATTAVDNDSVQLYFAHHVWIDHCEIWDGPAGNLDMTHAINWVTVSWTKFRYTTSYQRPSGESGDHRFSSLLGHSDNNASEDTGRIKVTFHHNWWAERVIERMPRVRFGQVHVFNNYFSSQNNNYCVRAGRNAALLVEGNYFDRVNSPHEFNNATDQGTAHITARNNAYQNTTGARATGGGGPAFASVPYSATIEPASGIPSVVQACAGPR